MVGKLILYNMILRISTTMRWPWVRRWEVSQAPHFRRQMILWTHSCKHKKGFGTVFSRKSLLTVQSGFFDGILWEITQMIGCSISIFSSGWNVHFAPRQPHQDPWIQNHFGKTPTFWDLVAQLLLWSHPPQLLWQGFHLGDPCEDQPSLNNR